MAGSYDYYNKRKTSLEAERQSFITHYQELAEFVKPRRGRFFIQDRNKGDKRYNSIINSRATQAHKIATAGMLAGTMSPTRPWFALETYNSDLMTSQAVKEWLFKVETTIRTIFNESNFYGMASQLLSELLLFSTGLMFHVDDFDDVARFYTQTVGAYYLAANDKYKIDTAVREFELTVKQLVEWFGNNVSTTVRTHYDRGEYDKWYPVCHFVEPNNEFSPNSPLAKNKKFVSIYYEPGHSGIDKKFLSVSGFDEFPCYAPRWEVTGEDIYGTDCPGMTALGDIKGLQLEERRKAQAIDKMVNPPLIGPPSIKNIPVNSLPGGVTIYDGDDQRQKLEPLYLIQPQLQELRLDMDSIEQRIDKAFFVDMFLAITNIEGIQPRNQLDLMQRNEERLLQLGPVLERLQGEFLNPAIDRVFNQCIRANILPPIPEELSNQPLKIRYISSLALAQRALATQTIERISAYVGNLIALGWPQAADKLNVDAAIEEYAKVIGLNPKIIPDQSTVDQIRNQRQAQQQLMQLAETAEMGAKAAQAAGSTDLSGDNLASRIANG